MYWRMPSRRLRRVAEVPPEKRHRRSLADRERDAHAHRDGGKEKADKKVEPEAGVYQFADLLFRIMKLPSRYDRHYCGKPRE